MVTDEPSHAKTRNSSSSLISCMRTSGFAVTICFSGASSLLFLYSKSPIALDKASLPIYRYGVNSFQDEGMRTVDAASYHTSTCLDNPSFFSYIKGARLDMAFNV